jgi:putative transposase
VVFVAPNFSSAELGAAIAPSCYVFPSRPARLRGFDYRGPYRYSLTFCCYRRQRPFADPATVARTLALFLQTADELGFAVLAYCFMPDHVHLLAEGLTDDADLRAFAKRSRQRAAVVHAACGQGRLWQEGYFERVLRADEDSITVCRYILFNPVRSGLVRQPSEYPFLSTTLAAVEDLG